MAIINHAKREINAKVVYFGHEGAGKGTSLRYVYGRIKPSLRSELKILSTAGSSLLFFDFTPFEQPIANGYRIRFQIYTLNGVVTNPAAWKMMLKGIDGLVLVAEAAQEKLAECRESVLQLREVLNSYGVTLDDIPLVLQLNKRDLAGMVTPDEAASYLKLAITDVWLTTATTGDGVLEVLTSLSRKIMTHIGGLADMSQAENAIVACDSQSRTDGTQILSGTVAPEKSGLEASSIAPQVQVDRSPDIEAADNSGFHVRVITDDICMTAGSVRIPLEIARHDGLKRLIVSVTVEPG